MSAVHYSGAGGRDPLFLAEDFIPVIDKYIKPELVGINNTIEAVLYCKGKGIGAYQGGTCNETDRSAQVCVHCAMATNLYRYLQSRVWELMKAI